MLPGGKKDGGHSRLVVVVVVAVAVRSPAALSSSWIALSLAEALLEHRRRGSSQSMTPRMVKVGGTSSSMIRKIEERTRTGADSHDLVLMGPRKSLIFPSTPLSCSIC